MNRLIFPTLFAAVSPCLYAQETKFESVITQAGYVYYMAEKTCLAIHTKSKPTAEILSKEWVEQMLAIDAELSKKIDPKYGLDKLSEDEKKNMVSHFKRMGNTNNLVMQRLREISPSCNSELPPSL